MFTVLSALVAIACVLASVRRLAGATLCTWLDPKLFGEALRDSQQCDVSALRQAISSCERATWEHGLLDAVEVQDSRSRVALVNEQLFEVDWALRRWAGVPRACASVAMIAGFLFACVGLLGKFASPAGDARSAVEAALDALAVGIAGASFCVAVHLRARRVVMQRSTAIDTLVNRLFASTERAASCTLARR